MESFFNSLKNERVHVTRYRTLPDAEADLFDYIETVLQPETAAFHAQLRLANEIPGRLDQHAA